MWPREICDMREKDGKRLFIKDAVGWRVPGVYVLYRDEHPYYIGKSKKVGPRIWEHANRPLDPYYNFWNMFSAFLVEEMYLDAFEGMLIAAMPTGNSAVPRIPKIAIPRGIVDQLKRIRQHQAHPVTLQQLIKAIKGR